MILDNLFPIFALLGAGVVLKRFDLTGEAFLKRSDRLVYFFFFPSLLFWKIGGAPIPRQESLNYCLIPLFAVVGVFFLGLILVRILSMESYRVGSFSQSTYRFNTYLGMAVVASSLGEEGIRYFGLLVSMAIPVINLLAVSVLIWFSGKSYSAGERVRLAGRAVLTNPLILACLFGIAYANAFSRFPAFVDNTFRLITSAALPLALLSIGGALTFGSLRRYLTPALLASAIKLAVLPLVGYVLLRYFRVVGLPFRVAMIFLCLPTAPAIYVLSSQLNSDTDLASASIALSTVFSFLSLSVALLL